MRTHWVSHNLKEVLYITSTKRNSRYLDCLWSVGLNQDLTPTVTDSKAMLLTPSSSHLNWENVEGRSACIVHLEWLAQHQGLKQGTSCTENILQIVTTYKGRKYLSSVIPHHSWWGLVWAETCPTQWVTLYNICLFSRFICSHAPNSCYRDKNTWQSWIEIKSFSVVCFKQITKFNTLCARLISTS